MSDLPVYGTRASPLRMGPGQRIVAVQWGGGIGVLTVDMPQGYRVRFAPIDKAYTDVKARGMTIGRADFAKYHDGEDKPAPVSLLTTPSPMILGVLYGEGDTHWGVFRVMRSYGPDPGQHVNPSPFPPGGLEADTHPNLAWDEYRRLYNEEKDKFLAKPGERRWIEVADLKSLGDDTLIGGDARRYFGSADSWQNLDYGEVALYWYELVPYEPPRFNILGAPQFNTVFRDIDARAPGNIGYQPNGFTLFHPVAPAPWGLGETLVAGNPGRKAVREVYLLDFQVIRDTEIVVSSDGEGPDEHLAEGYTVRYALRLFGGGAKFKVEALGVTPVAPAAASYSQTKSFPYTRSGELFRVNRQGFVV